MSKRRFLNAQNSGSIMARLEELILANSGADVFEESLKLALAKLWEDLHPESVRVYSGDRDVNPRERICRVLRQASSAWPDILPEFAPPAMSDDHLALCISLLRPIDFLDSNVDFLDALFEVATSRQAKGSKGQYFTPRHVVDFCVQLLKPRRNERICDPACGSGAFLIHSARRIQSGVQLHTDEPLPIWGFDFDPRAVRVAKCLMLIAGHCSSHISQVNSLLLPSVSTSLFDRDEAPAPFVTIEDVMRTQSRHFKGFDVILTNPPFAGEIREESLLSAYRLGHARKNVERDVLFLERCVRLLRPGGRLAIILPDNKLGSGSWQHMREWLLREFKVLAVIGLGRNTFLPHTHQKTSVLVGTRRFLPSHEYHQERILFAISELDGKNSRGDYVLGINDASAGPSWRRATHDLKEIAGAFEAFCEEQSITWGRENGASVN